MSKAVSLLKSTGAVITFFVAYSICVAIARIMVQLVNYDAQGFWIYFISYFVAVMAGIAGVYFGLTVVERWFPTVRPRTVVWVIIGLECLIWGFILFGLLMGTELQDETPPQAIQALVSVIVAWKMTADDAEFGSDIHR
jgi:hypothetical protein